MSSSKRPLSSPTFQSSKRQHVHREADGELPEQIHDQAPEKIISAGGNKVKLPSPFLYDNADSR
jgi:hypothetical protein